MIKNFLGKMLVPRHPDWEREHEHKQEIAMAVTGILFVLVSAGITGLVMYWRNTLGR